MGRLDDEGRAMEMESHTEIVIALIMLALFDVVDLENQVPQVQQQNV